MTIINNIHNNAQSTDLFSNGTIHNGKRTHSDLLHHIISMCQQIQISSFNQSERKYWFSLLSQSSSSFNPEIITHCNIPSVLSSHSKNTNKTSIKSDFDLNNTHFAIFTQQHEQLFIPKDSTEYAKQSAMNQEHHGNHHQNGTGNTSNQDTTNNASNEQSNQNNNELSNAGGRGGNGRDDDGDEKKNNDNINPIEEKKEEEPIAILEDPLGNNSTSRTVYILKTLGVISAVLLAIIFGSDFISTEKQHENGQLRSFYKQVEDFLNVYDAELIKREKNASYEPFTADIPDDHPSQSWLNGLYVGSLIDALDVESKWYTGYITNIDIKTGNVKVHYDDWPNRFNEWVQPESGKIAPYRSHAIGGQSQGGLPGRPLLPIKPDNGSVLTPFQKMRLSFLKQQKTLPDITVYIINIDAIQEYKTVLTDIFYEIDIVYNDRAVYMNLYKIYIFYSSKGSWCIGKDYSEKTKPFMCISSDALRPELMKVSKQSDIILTKVPFSPAYLSRVNKHKYTPIGKKGLKNIPTIKLNNKVMLPLVIVGTAGISRDKLDHVIDYAGKLGYYMYDTGTQSVMHPSYFNHRYLHDLFDIYGRSTIGISTKIAPFAHGYHSTIQNFISQLNTLGTDYIDLVLIEHPHCIQKTNIMDIECEGHWLDTWRALEFLYEKKRIRALGVSQFTVKQLNVLIQHKQKHIPLSVVRDWRDPLHPNTALFDWCIANDVHFEAFSPLGGQYTGSNPVLTHPIIKRIATKHKMSTAQVVIKWNTRRGIGIVLRSEDDKHLSENLDTFSFGRLTDKELRELDTLRYADTSSSNPNAKKEPLVFNVDGDNVKWNLKSKRKKKEEKEENVELLDD